MSFKLTYLFTLSFLFLMMPLRALAEDHELSGVVKERNGEVMPGILVTIRDSGDNTVAYTTTNRNGAFRVVCPAGVTDARVVVSCLGFSTVTLPVKGFKANSLIVLDEEALQLKEVTVKIPPIKSVGDTLTYDVASFKSAGDRSIEDIIKKLPGISVTNEGRIYYNGEPINKFYIEGLDLLAGRYALASRNISPDDVTSVNVYENHQSKRVLKDIQYSDKAAINLKLKKKSMLRPIGYFKAGGGADIDEHCLWVGEAFGLLVSPKTQMLVSAKANDAGKSYFNETKNLVGSDMTSSTKAYDVYPLNPFGSADIPASRYYDNQSVSASVNGITKLSEYTNLNVVADYADERVDYHNAESITYVTGDNESIIISESADNNPHQREAKLKLKLENNAPKSYLSDDLSFTGHFNSNRYDVANTQSYFQKVSTRDVNIRNALKGIFRISNNAIDFKSDTQFSTTPLNRLSARTGDETFILQNVRGSSFKNREEFGYSWLINARSFIGVKTVFDLSYDKFKSVEDIPVTSVGNDVDGYDITTTIEPIYQNKLSSRVTLNISVPLRISNLKFDDLLTDKEHRTDRFDVDWKSSINYNTPFNLKTIFSFGRQNRLGGLSDYIVNPLRTTFRQSSVLGTGRLSQRTSHYANANFAYRNALEGMFSSASVMYRHTTSNRLGGLNINDADDIQSSSHNIDNKSHLLNASFSISKKIFSCNTSFKFDGSYEMLKKETFRQNRVMNMDMNNYVCRININTNPLHDYIVADLDFRHSYTTQKVSLAESDSHTNSTTVSLTLTSTPVKNLELSASGNYSKSTMSSGIDRHSCFIDCGVRYHIGSFDIEVSARNLTNTKEYSYNYIHDSDIYSYSFRLRPLETLVTFKYSF